MKRKALDITNNHLRKNFDSIDAVLVKTIQRIEDMRNRQEDNRRQVVFLRSTGLLMDGSLPTWLFLPPALPGKQPLHLTFRNAALHPTAYTHRLF